MEKLSGILPSSPRVKSVDLSDAQPIRPGVRSYGRPVGVNPLKDRFTVSQEAKDMAFKETLGAINPREAKSVRIADELSKNFFDTRVGAEIKKRPASEETHDRQSEIADMTSAESFAPYQDSSPRLEAADHKSLDLEA